MHANITDLFGKISSLLSLQDTVGPMRHQRVFTVASSAVLEKFANRVLTRNFDQIAFAISHCWHRSNWFEQPHFIHLHVGHRVQPFWKPPLPVLFVMLRTCIGELR